MEYITQTAEETKEIGRRLSANLGGNGAVFALSGDLGAGKTTFVQGFAEGLGITSRVNSPTFIIMRTYQITNHLPITTLYHVDLYRLENNIEDELRDLGILDMWGIPENIFIIEWAEKAKGLIPENSLWIKFEDLEEDRRKITIENKVADASIML